MPKKIQLMKILKIDFRAHLSIADAMTFVHKNEQTGKPIEKCLGNDKGKIFYVNINWGPYVHIKS